MLQIHTCCVSLIALQGDQESKEPGRPCSFSQQK